MMNMAAGAARVHGAFGAGYQYGPVAISGGVGVLSISKVYDPSAVMKQEMEDIGDVPAQAAKAYITLHDLKKMIALTGKMKLPSYRQLMEMESPVVASKRVDGAKITVYENGFASYTQGNAHTVMAVDRLSGYRYDFVDGTSSFVPEEVFDDSEWSVRLVMEGEKKLEHNRNVMAERNETSKTESDGTEDIAVGMIDFLDEANRKALADRELERLYTAIGKLTERQQQVIQLYYFKEMTQQEIAEELGITRQRVGVILDGAIKKLKKAF